MFADDAVIIAKDPEETGRKVTNFMNTMKMFDLYVNTAKSKYIAYNTTFDTKIKEITRTDRIKYLGETITEGSKMTAFHIKEKITKAKQYKFWTGQVLS